jgi:hypothetical protein
MATITLWCAGEILAIDGNAVSILTAQTLCDLG